MLFSNSRIIELHLNILITKINIFPLIFYSGSRLPPLLLSEAPEANSVHAQVSGGRLREALSQALARMPILMEFTLHN